MGKLQLADNGTPAKMENYIYVPAGFMGSTENRYIREDVLDELPDDQYYEIMSSIEEMEPMLGDRESRRARRQARREARQTRRAERRANRQRRKDYRMTKGERRREARERRLNIRQAGRTERAFGRQKAYGGAISGVLNKAGSMLPQEQMDQRGFPVGGSVSFGTGVWDQYKWPIIIGGTILIGGVAYILTKK